MTSVHACVHDKHVLMHTCGDITDTVTCPFWSFLRACSSGFLSDTKQTSSFFIVMASTAAAGKAGHVKPHLA